MGHLTALLLLIQVCSGVNVNCTSYASSGALSGGKGTDGSESPCLNNQRVYRRFTSATEADLQCLKSEANDGLAIRAAWEEVRRRLPKPDEGLFIRDPTMAVPVKGVPRFLGYVEGRLKVPLPQWWAAELENARAYDRDSLVLFREYPHRPGARSIAPAFGIVPEVARDGTNEIRLSWDKRRLALPVKSAPFPSVTRFRGLVVGKQCVIARYNFVSASPFELFCVDIESRRQIWSTQVWCGCSRTGGASGPLSHDIDLVCREGVLFVFGMEERTAYIEAFAMADGRNLLRFNTTY